MRILKSCNHIDDSNIDKSFDYCNKSIFMLFYDNNDNNINKIILEKIYMILLNINDKATDIFNIFIQEFINILKKLNQNFQKFFTLFYLIIQYISKSPNIEFIKEIKQYYISESLNIENNLFEISNKSLFVSITKINNPNIVQFIGEYLSSLFNNKNKYQFSQDLQKLILLYIQNEKDNEQRKKMIKSVIKYLNENKDIMAVKDSCNFILGIVKINNDDVNLIKEEEVKNLFNEEIKKQLDELLNIKNNEKKEEEQNKENNENNEEDDDEGFDEVDG